MEQQIIKINEIPFTIYSYNWNGKLFIFMSNNDSGARITIGRNGIISSSSFSRRISNALEQACMLWSRNNGFAGLDLVSFLKTVGAVDEFGEMI